MSTQANVPCPVVYPATHPVSFGIVSGRINFRHQFPAGDRAGRPVGGIVSRRRVLRQGAVQGGMEEREASWPSRADAVQQAMYAVCDAPFHKTPNRALTDDDRPSRHQLAALQSCLIAHALLLKTRLTVIRRNTRSVALSVYHLTVHIRNYIHFINSRTRAVHEDTLTSYLSTIVVIP